MSPGRVKRTSHQKGVIEGAAEFRRRLDAFAGVVEKLEAALLAFLGEPRTVEEIVDHRLDGGAAPGPAPE
ncbi:hypothetical protein [Streptomyces sp. Ru71]|uniref:hypothetical protein n=1 Tax=Streptomyces sp. Ru71 TaxID=2080746 RepID=UPI0015E43646|nr:hypothetical protein [Streptomyces sp. Ru71]